MKPSDKQDRADVFPFNGLKFKILQEGGSTIIQNKFLIQGNPRESNVYQQSVARVLKMGEQIIVPRCLNMSFRFMHQSKIEDEINKLRNEN